ncbi:MAG: glycosyltransferase family 39 protein [Candidatus Omnitrophota bacterium]
MFNLKNLLKNQPEYFFLSIIIAIGAFFRFYRLGAHDLWFDEACVAMIQYGQGFSLSGVISPFFYVILSPWVHFWGMNEFGLRLLPALFSLGSIFLIFLAGRKLFDAKIGTISALILAFSPFNIWYAQDLQSYSLSVFWALLITYLFLKSVESKGLIFWLSYCLALTAGILTDEFLLCFLPAQAIYLLYRSRSSLRIWVLMVLPTLILSLSKIISILWSLQAYGFWVPKPTFISLLFTFENFNLGYSCPPGLYVISDLLCILIIGWAIIGFRKKVSSSPSFIFCLASLLIPLGAIFIISRISTSIYIDRRLMPLSTFYYMIIAVLLMSIKARSWRFICIFSWVALLSFGLLGYYSDYLPDNLKHHLGVLAKEPYRPAVEFIKMHLSKNDLIAHTHNVTLYPFKFYLKDHPNLRQVFLTSGRSTDYWSKIYVRHQDYAWIEQFPDSWMKHNIWLVSSNWERNNLSNENEDFIKNWLGDNFRQDLSVELYGVRIKRYLGN